MKWIEEYATGITRIDEHHKMIFKTAEDFRLTLDAGQGENTYGLLLDFLDLYVRGHFGLEETCMDEYRCPVARKNKQAHAGFLQVLQGYREQFAAGGYRADDARALVDAIDKWLDEHICRTDVQLKGYVRHSPAAMDYLE
jgi:hemerythrin